MAVTLRMHGDPAARTAWAGSEWRGNCTRLDMKSSTPLARVFLDLVMGSLACGLFCLFSIYSFDWRGMGTMFAAAGLLFIFAGFLRGASVPAVSGVKALVLVLPFGFALPSFVLIRFEVVIFVVIAFGSAIAGIYARRSWKVGGRNRSLFILAATLGVVEIVSSLVAPMLAEKMTTRTVDVPAQEFSATSLNGKTVESAELKGSVTVLYCWATWCPPCWQDFPKVEKLFERYETDQNVIFLAVNLGGNGDTPEVVRSFIQNGGYRIPTAYGDRRAAAALHVKIFPCLVVLDKWWHVRLVHTGYDGSEHFVQNLSREIDLLLKEPHEVGGHTG
jgi:thiol-disulfide isomerase/thioredoxin